MMHKKPAQAKLLIPEITLTEVCCHTGDSVGRKEKHLTREYSLWLVRQGQVRVTVEGEAYTASPGRCVLVPPASILEFAAFREASVPLEVFEITCTMNSAAAAAFGGETLTLPAPAQLAEEAGELEKLCRSGEALTLLRCHIRFQELMALLLELKSQDAGHDTKQKVEQTIHYLQRSYHKDIRINQLADETKLSRWQYNDLFKTMTGRTPVQYLNDLRIGRAKELLMSSSYLLKEIAEQTGFRDEYYFSRRFKQSVGISPSQYTRSLSGGVRICSFNTLGDLLSLGITPVGINRSLLEQFQEMKGTIESLDEEPIDREKLLSLQPDIIVCPSYAPRQIYQDMSSIAPTMVINWNDHIYDRLHKLGRMLGKSSAAKSWIEQYKDKASLVREQLKAHLNGRESAAAFVYHNQGLYVYGGHNFGHTLYEGLGLTPPDGIRRLIEHNAKWQKILPGELAFYEADLVFLAVGEKERGSEGFRQLLQSSAWSSLPAARSGKAYVVENRWGLYDALTLERHLDEMLVLLA
jgi:AraC family transcriptional regulator, transcriptional activator for feuABC-ybbA operon